MLRTSRVAVLLVAAAILGLCAGVLWESAQRLAEQRTPADQSPALIVDE
jgi:divalent metal cation (Fe/Co/Zn/Cd) transporter